MDAEFGQLKRINLRDIWFNEARDFSPWLANHIHELGKAIGLELELTDREAKVGDFSVDILAKDLGTGDIVVVENQFGTTDHDHLGKLLTYASGFDASAIIWIAEQIRDEHRQTLDWLNQRTDTETLFFGIVVEVLSIDQSKPAYSFRPVVFPNEWQKTRRREGASSTSPRAEAYREYFQALIDELREVYKFTGARVGQPQNWYSFASGYTEASYGASFALVGQMRIDLYLDQGDAEANKEWFDKLFAEKETIESEYGRPLEWERLDDKRASRVAIYKPGSIEDDEEQLAEYRDGLIDNLLRMKEVFDHWLEKLQQG